MFSAYLSRYKIFDGFKCLLIMGIYILNMQNVP